MPIPCGCGGQMTRVHRTFREKLVYMAVYRCRRCGALKSSQRRFMFYFQEGRACPLCGTKRLSRLTSPDRIDPMRWNLYNWLRWAVDVQLYHCRYCRIQFYDRLRVRKEADASQPG